MSTFLRALIAAPLILGAIYAYAWTLAGLMNLFKHRHWRRAHYWDARELHDGDGGADSPILYEHLVRRG